MSKLYIKASTDAINKQRTARGHKEADTNILYNFGGGQQPTGNVSVSVAHNGEKVQVTMTHYHNGKIIKQDRYNVGENGEIEGR